MTLGGASLSNPAGLSSLAPALKTVLPDLSVIVLPDGKKVQPIAALSIAVSRAQAPIAPVRLKVQVEAKGRPSLLKTFARKAETVTVKELAALSPQNARLRLNTLFENPAAMTSPGEVVAGRTRRNFPALNAAAPSKEFEAAAVSEVSGPKAVSQTWLNEEKREKALRWFHVARGAHFFGQYLFSVAQPFFLFLLVKEGLTATVTGQASLTAVLAVGSLGYAAISLLTGAVINRFGTKKVFVASLSVMSVLAAGLPLLYWVGVTPLWLMVGMNIGINALGAAHAVSEGSIIPALVGNDRAKLQKTNITLEIVYGAVAAVSALLTGHLIDLFGPIVVIMAYPLIHLFIVLPIYIKKMPDFVSIQSVGGSPAKFDWAQVKKGLKTLLRSKTILGLFGLLAAFEFIATPFRSAVLPILGDMEFAGLGAFLGNAVFAFFVGYTAANYLARRYSSFPALMRWLRLSALGFLPFAFLGFLPMTSLTVTIGMGLFAFLIAPGRTTLRTLIQHEVQKDAPHQMGFVFGIYTAVSALMGALGMGLIGLLSTSLNPVFPTMFFWLAPIFGLTALLYFFLPRWLSKWQK